MYKVEDHVYGVPNNSIRVESSSGRGGKKNHRIKSSMIGEHSDGFSWTLYVDRVFEETTLHGLPNAYRADNLLLRLIFIALFLASTGYCVYQMTITVLSYIQYDIITTTRTYYESPTNFPVVSYCNLNMFDYNYASEIIEPIVRDGTIKSKNYKSTIEYVEALNDYYRFNLLKKFLNRTDDLGIVYGFQERQTLISCRFQGEACSYDQMVVVFDYSYGNCIRFNQGLNSTGHVKEILNTGQSGKKFGLQLELYTGNPGLQEKYVVNHGFRVSVFNQSNPYHIHEDSGVDVATGVETNIAISRRFIIHLASPYGDCLDNDVSKIDWNQNDVLNFMYNHFILGNYLNNGYFVWNWTIGYTQNLCLKLCFQKYIFSKCGCYDVTLPKSPLMTTIYAENACVNTSQIDCYSDAEQLFYSSSNLTGVCYEKCPIECNEVRYELKTSLSTYPSEWYASLLMKNRDFNSLINMFFQPIGVPYINYSNYDTLVKTIARVNLFYEDMSYTQMDESPAMTFDTFLANTGGSLGLFMGASLLTLCEGIEIAYYLLLVAFRLMTIKSKKKRVRALMHSSLAITESQHTDVRRRAINLDVSTSQSGVIQVEPVCS